MSTSASSVSAKLRAAGFPIQQSTKREGLRVRRGALPGYVNVSADFDSPGLRVRTILDAQDHLLRLGYTVTYNANHLTVSRVGN